MQELDKKTKLVRDGVVFLIVITVLVFLFGLLGLVWHYLLCAWCMIGCIFCLVRDNYKTARIAAVVTAFFSVFGFLCVYEGSFRPSGKTFSDYVTVYGLFTLPILIFPIVCFVALKLGKKDDKLKGTRHGKL